MNEVTHQPLPDKLHHLLIDILRPTAYELLLYFSSALMFVGAALIANLATDTTYSAGQTNVADQLNRQSDQFLLLLQDGALTADVVTFIFWLFVGGLVYSIAWAAITAFIDTYNDIHISAAYVHPESFHQSSFWFAAFSRKMIRAFAWLSLLFAAYLLLAWFVPVWFDVARAALQTVTDSRAVTGLATSFASVAFSVYVMRVLWRLAIGH